MSTHDPERLRRERTEAAVEALTEIQQRYPDVMDVALEAIQAKATTMRGVQWGKQSRAHCKKQAANPGLTGPERITYYAKGYGERPPILGGKGKHPYCQVDSTWQELFDMFFPGSTAQPNSMKTQLKRWVRKAVETKRLQSGSTPLRLMVNVGEFDLGR